MINLDGMTDDEKLAALESIHKSIAESKEVQKQKIASNVDLIVKALKKIEDDAKGESCNTGTGCKCQVWCVGRCTGWV